MPNITVQQMPKTTEQKRELVARITDAFMDVYGPLRRACTCGSRRSAARTTPPTAS